MRVNQSLLGEDVFKSGSLSHCCKRENEFACADKHKLRNVINYVMLMQ